MVTPTDGTPTDGTPTARCASAAHGRRYSRWVWLMAALLSAFTSASRAQVNADALAEPPDMALEHYARGQAAYGAGRIREASQWFERALLLDPHSPALTYQVALVHEQLGNIPKAVRYYERYLNHLTHHEAEERLRIHRTLRRLRASLRPELEPGEGEDGPLLVDLARKLSLRFAGTGLVRGGRQPALTA